MDQRPDELEAKIDRTRRTLDRDLTRLAIRFDAAKDHAAAQAQWWAGLGAIAAGVAGTLIFWPRRRRA